MRIVFKSVREAPVGFCPVVISRTNLHQDVEEGCGWCCSNRKLLFETHSCPLRKKTALRTYCSQFSMLCTQLSHREAPRTAQARLAHATSVATPISSSPRRPADCQSASCPIFSAALRCDAASVPYASRGRAAALRTRAVAAPMNGGAPHAASSSGSPAPKAAAAADDDKSAMTAVLLIKCPDQVHCTQRLKMSSAALDCTFCEIAGKCVMPPCQLFHRWHARLTDVFYISNTFNLSCYAITSIPVAIHPRFG